MFLIRINLLTFGLLATAKLSSGIDLGYEEEIACEHETRHINCEDRRVIVIKSGFYGRQNSQTCSDSGNNGVPNGGCSSTSAQSRIEQTCNGQQSCRLQASNGIFGDPCRGTYKYMKVSWTCVDVKEYISQATACEGRGLTISCAGGSVIEIQSGFYGRTTNNICVNSAAPHFTCSSDGALQAVKSRCDGATRCYVPASNRLFGDPCPGTYKYLAASWTCDQRDALNPIKAVACEHESPVRVFCSSGQTVQIVSASYGRSEANKCSPQSVPVNGCHSSKSLDMVRARCQNRRHCTLFARNSIFGDPCRGTRKYLEIEYYCS